MSPEHAEIWKFALPGKPAKLTAASSFLRYIK